MKHACGSNARDPQNRSDKKCVCGGHSKKVKRKPRQVTKGTARRAGRAT